jgi:hypothetical protein
MAKTIAQNIGIFWLKIWIVAQVFQENAFFLPKIGNNRQMTQGRCPEGSIEIFL